MKQKRVLTINSATQTIGETTIAGLTDAQTLVGGLIERAFVFPNGDELYVNEEGLLGQPEHFFTVKGGQHPFAGNAFVVGEPTNSGENRDVSMDKETLKGLIRFVDAHTLKTVLSIIKDRGEQ